MAERLDDGVERKDWVDLRHQQREELTQRVMEAEELHSKCVHFGEDC